MSDPWEGLGAVEIEAPAEPPMGVLEQMAALGGMEPGGGRDYQDPAIQRAQMDVAGPSLWESAKALGPMLLPGGAGLGFMGRTALNAAEAGGTAAAVSAIEDERWREDPKAAAWEALANGGKGAALGGALSGVMSGVEAGASALKPYAQQAARRAQSAVEGLSGPTFRNLAKSHGLDWTRDDLAQAAIDTAPSHVLPQTTDWYRTQRAAQKANAGAEYGQAVDQLTDEVPNAIGLDDFTQRLDDHGDQYLSSTIKEERAKAGTIGEYRDTVAGMYGTGQVGDVQLSPRDLQREKQALTARGFPEDSTMTVSDADRAATYRDAASVPRQAMDEAARRASAETQAQYLATKERYGIADTLADSTNRKASFDQSQQRGGLWDSLTGPVRDRIPDATSMAMQGAGKGLGALERWASLEGQAGARLAGSELGQTTAENHREERERVSNASRGHELNNAVMQALATNPQSLGPYAQQFMEAQQSGDPMRMSTLLHELNDDPQARNTILRQLQQSTIRQGDF